MEGLNKNLNGFPVGGTAERHPEEGQEAALEGRTRGEKMREALIRLMPIFKERLGNPNVLERIVGQNKSSFGGLEDRG